MRDDQLGPPIRPALSFRLYLPQPLKIFAGSAAAIASPSFSSSLPPMRIIGRSISRHSCCSLGNRHFLGVIGSADHQGHEAVTVRCRQGALIHVIAFADEIIQAIAIILQPSGLTYPGNAA